MKKSLFTMLLSSGFLCASSVSENLAYSEELSKQPIVQSMNTKKNIGHITFKVGPGTSLQHYGTLIPAFGIGYQSRLSDSVVFQSTMIEFGGAGKEIRSTKDNIECLVYEAIFFYPKIMGIHYWNKHSENRFFTSIGSNIFSSVYEKRTNNYSNWEAGTTKKSKLTALGGSLAFGLEMGQPNEAINTIKIELDQPIVEIYTEGEVSLYGSLTISYVIGF